MNKGKILYFDYWTTGLHNFKFFDEALRARGFDVKLLHIGSWRDPNTPQYQEIDGIKCYDISYYKTKLLFNIVKLEAPKAIVTLNSSFTMDRAMTLICKTLGIKLVYLMHGIMTREEYIEDSIRTTNRIRKKGRLYKTINQLKKTVPNYLYSLYKYDKRYLFKLYPYSLLVKTFFDPTRYMNFPPPSFDLKPDLALVFGNIDKRFYQKSFPGGDTTIKVIGNPNLDSYFLNIKNLPLDKDRFLAENNIPHDMPYITYLEEGFVEDKFWSNEYRLSFCQALIDACKETGFRLVIKLHPRTVSGDFADSFKKLKDATIIGQVNLPKLLYFTDKCICHYSTTLIYAILLHKPILVPRWGSSALLPMLYKEREVTVAESIDALKTYLSDDGLEYEREEYLNDYVPYTDGKTSERIVDSITEIIT